MSVRIPETPSRLAKSLRTAAAQPPQVISGNLSVTSTPPVASDPLTAAPVEETLPEGVVLVTLKLPEMT